MKVMPMVDMRLTPKEAVELYCPTSADLPEYPYGLSIRLCSDELEKLGIDFDELCVDDMVHMHCLAVVISKCKSERQSGDDNKEISLQITHIAAEDEDEENSKSESKITSKLYR